MGNHYDEAVLSVFGFILAVRGHRRGSDIPACIRQQGIHHYVHWSLKHLQKAPNKTIWSKIVFDMPTGFNLVSICLTLDPDTSSSKHYCFNNLILIWKMLMLSNGFTEKCVLNQMHLTNLQTTLKTNTNIQTHIHWGTTNRCAFKKKLEYKKVKRQGRGL